MVSPTPAAPSRSGPSDRQYHVLARIGQGAFGRVYKARYLQGPVAMDVALKVLNQHAGPMDKILARMMDEARYLGLLNHEAIVKVLGVVQLRGEWTVVMELVDGRDLRHVLEGARLPLRVALEITRDIAEALDYAFHRQDADGRQLSLIHRDIKPANIQITGDGKVKLLDFGIARADISRSSETVSMQPMTPAYAPPELRRLLLDPDAVGPDPKDGQAGDVFSLGMVLAEMLQGERPPPGPLREDAHALWTKQILDRVSQDPECTSALRDLVRAMLARLPQDRPTAADVERRCMVLVDELRGEGLRSWFRRSLPALPIGGLTQAEDPWVGAILQESTPGDAKVVEPKAPAPVGAFGSRWSEASLRRAATVAAVVLFAVALLIWKFRSDVPAQPEIAPAPAAKVETRLPISAPITAPPTPPVVAEPTVPTPTPPIEDRTKTTPVHEKTKRGGTTHVEAPTIATTPVAPPEAAVAPPAEAAPSLAMVRFTGADAVELIGEGGSYTLPGKVPFGIYAIKASFPVRGVAQTGKITIDGDHTIVCDPANTRCK